MKLLDYLDASRIELHLKGTTKDQILSDLVTILTGQGAIAQKDDLLATLLQRESLGSTGIGHGVAIPHGRCRELTRPAVVFGRAELEVNFDSIDGLPARIFFLLVAPESENNDHLHLLAQIARLMRDPAIREQLLTLSSPEAVLEVLGGHDGE